MPKKHPKNKNKKAFITISIVIVLIVLGIFYINSRDDSPINNEVNTTPKVTPATKEDQDSADSQKTNFSDNQQKLEEKQNSNTSSDDKSKTNIFISYAGQDGNIINVNTQVEQYENGTCTYTFAKGDQTVSKQSPAYTDAKTTICTNPEIDRSIFPSSGDWELIVTFSSKHYEGNSKPQIVKIT